MDIINSENREHAIISFASLLIPMLRLTPLRNCTSYCVIVVDDDGASTSQSFGQSGTVKYYAHHIVFFTSNVVVSNSVLTEKRFKKFNSKEEKEDK